MFKRSQGRREINHDIGVFYNTRQIVNDNAPGRFPASLFALHAGDDGKVFTIPGKADDTLAHPPHRPTNYYFSFIHNKPYSFIAFTSFSLFASSMAHIGRRSSPAHTHLLPIAVF